MNVPFFIKDAAIFERGLFVQRVRNSKISLSKKITFIV